MTVKISMSVSPMGTEHRTNERTFGAPTAKQAGDVYKKEILKFSSKKLSYLKKPTKRKRDLVQQFAFTLIAKSKKFGAYIKSLKSMNEQR